MPAYGDFSRLFHEQQSTDPNVCVASGVDAHLDELPDPTLAHARDDVANATALLAVLAETRKVPDLGFDHLLDLDLAELSLRAQVHTATFTFNGSTTQEQMPTAGTDIGSGIFLLFANDPRPSGERLSDITRRIERIPDYLQALLGRLSVPIARWRRMDVEKVEGLPSLFSAIEAWARQTAWPDAERLRGAVARAEEALAEYARDLARSPTVDSVFIGAETAARVVQLRGIRVPVSELHRWARDFLDTTQGEIERLTGRLASKYGLPRATSPDELHAFLNRRFRLSGSGDDFGWVLDRYSRELDSIVRFVRDRGLFPILDDQRIVILKTPGFMEPTIPAGAMMSPPPFRSGTSTSLVYLTLSEALLDEHTELTIPTMMIHEGIPGHHLQLATASRHPSVIRRHVQAMDQAEGWTTMLEDYMLDAGYAAELAEEVRFCGKRDICRLGARVAIDLFFMTGDRTYLEVGQAADIAAPDPFVAAGNLLAKVTGFVPERVEAELNWYSQERGYPLSYLTGNRLVWQLKEDVAKAGTVPGGELDRRFHEAFLEAGNMPVAMLRRVFENSGLLHGSGESGAAAARTSR